MILFYLNGAGEAITREADKQEDLPNPDETLPALAALLAAILVHEHRDPSDDHQDEEVLEERIPLAANQDAQHHDGDWFAGLADDLGGVVDPGESLVRGHHRRQVSQGAHGVVAAPRRVLLCRGEDERHDEGVEIIDDALEEDQCCDGGESFLLSIMNVFATSSANMKRLLLSCHMSVHLHFFL